MLFQQLMELAVSIKMVLSIILIAPLAFRMGMSFPIELYATAAAIIHYKLP